MILHLYHVMLTSRQISLVKNSWKLLRRVDPELLGDVFYTKLFHDAPQTRSLFTTSRDEQSRKLIDMINIIVARLDEHDMMTVEMKSLGQRHTGYGVKPGHYKTVGKALLWTLEHALGKDWTREVGSAWETCYEMISQRMQDTEPPGK